MAAGDVGPALAPGLGRDPEVQPGRDLVVAQVPDRVAGLFVGDGHAPGAHPAPDGVEVGRGVDTRELLELSVPKATPFGRTMWSSSSIQITVGTLLMA